jgi:hypothetical protein
VSGDTPDIVLNEFGDLSRKARRELEARGIDPDTAVVEYIAATGQMPVITPEAAAAAKAEAQVEAAVASRDSAPVDIENVVAPVEEPAVELVIPPTPSVPPVSIPVTAAETGPIEPLMVAPALDSGSLSAVEETLAAVSDQTGELVTSGFDSLVNVEETDSETAPSKGEARRLARKEKKAQALVAKEEKAEALALAKAAMTAASEAALVEQAEQTQRDVEAAALAAIQAQEALDQQVALEREEAEARVVAERIAAEEAQASAVSGTLSEEIVEEAIDGELVTSEDGEFDDDELEPQTISEATAAIAIAEAVAAAEAVVEAGEVNIEYGNLANAAPATTGSISVISNALILPTLPETTGSIAPINPTGEIVITGSILIPSSVSQVGANLENLDTSDIDVIKDEEEVAPTQGMAPVSAATAVSAYNISNSVVTTPRGMNERLPFILSITAAGLAVGVVALFVAGYFLGLF